MLGLGYAASTARGSVNWRTVGTALLLQAAIAALVLYVPQGGVVLDAAVRGVRHVLGFAMDGVKLVFGENFEENLGFTVALNVLPVIVFVGALMSVLYYLGIMQRIVLLMAKVMHRFLGVSGSESLGAAANVFMGQTEAPIIIAPYIPKMTISELMALMTGGFATIAGGVLAGYIAFGVPAGHLIAASVMSAPAALVIGKIIYPEREQSKTAGEIEIFGERCPAEVQPDAPLWDPENARLRA